MTYLLDTHAFYWFVLEPERLSSRALDLLKTTESTVYVSAVSGYEIGLKHALGKLAWHGSVSDAAKDAGFEPLPLTLEQSDQAARLPLVHRDPFDRLLAAQAITNKLVLVTADPAMKHFDVSLLSC